MLGSNTERQRLDGQNGQQEAPKTNLLPGPLCAKPEPT